jgi:Fe-S-cluster containining protein
MDAIYALSIHATYRCQRSGVCCSSDWDIPVELPLYRSLDAALATGRLSPTAESSDGDSPFIMEPDLPPGAAAMVARTSNGSCVFYHRGSGLCVIQRDLDETHLPSACRYFPRVAVRDQRGTFISLTHYCPTAAAMLFGPDGPIDIVESPPAFPPADYEGLRVDKEAWPPLLHPRMLMDLDGYSAWERHMVARCSESGSSPERVVSTLRRDAHALRRYTPDTGPLTTAVANLPVLAVDEPVQDTLDSSLLLHAEVLSAVPDDVRPEPDEEGLREAFERGVVPAWDLWHTPLRRYLAAKAFANWTAYQGRGVLTIVQGLEAALAFVRVEAARECRNAGCVLDADLLKQAFRATDFVLNHIAVSETLAQAWSRVED